MFNIKKRSIGIDISDFSIEVVEIEKNGEEKLVKAKSRILLEQGIIDKGEIRDAKKLRKTIRSLLSNSKLKVIKGQRIIFSLPDNQVYTNVFRVKLSEKRGIKQAVEREINNNIPLATNDISYAYKVVREENSNSNEQGLLVVIIAVRKSYLNEWNELFESVGLIVDHFETEALALFRGMFHEHPSKPVGILDIGASRSHFSIFYKWGIEYAFSSEIGGNLITKSIAERERKSFDEAEKIKLSMSSQNRGAELRELADRDLERLFKEVNETVKYFNEQRSSQDSADNDILDKVLLTGGGSCIEGLTDVVNGKKFEFKTEVGKGIVDEEAGDNNYIQAVGSAIRGLEDRWENTDPFLYAHRHSSGGSIAGLKQRLDDYIKDKLLHHSKKFFIWSSVFVVLFLLIFIRPVFKLIYSNGDEPYGNYADTFTTYVNIFGNENYADINIHKARLIETTVSEPKELDQLLVEQKNIAKKELYEGESLFPEPIEGINDANGIVFPVSLEWLAYDSEELKEHCLEQAKIKYQNDDLRVVNAELKKIDISDSDNMGALGGCEIISNSQIMENSDFAIKNITNKEKQIFVKIKQIGSNLNVREGAGTVFGIVEQAQAGEEFEFIEEKEGWYHIRLNEGKSGWVSSIYTEKITK